MMPKMTQSQSALVDLMQLLIPKAQRSDWRKRVADLLRPVKQIRDRDVQQACVDATHMLEVRQSNRSADRQSVQL
jgi:hypothetical protein